jgi:hypothetical protein
MDTDKKAGKFAARFICVYLCLSMAKTSFLYSLAACCILRLFLAVAKSRAVLIRLRDYGESPAFNFYAAPGLRHD